MVHKVMGLMGFRHRWLMPQRDATLALVPANYW